MQRRRRGVLVVTLLFVAVFAFAADAPPNEPARKTTKHEKNRPGIIVGGGVGVGYHVAKIRTVDATSGASTVAKEETAAGAGFAVRVTADFGIFRAGPGNIGVTTYFDFAAPSIYYGAGVAPRYRMGFKVNSSWLLSVAPWGGFGLYFAFSDDIKSDFYLNFALPLGVDFEVFVPRLYFTVAADLHLGCPVGTKGTMVIGGTEQDFDRRYNSYIFTIGFSYRVL